jgi:hypothetical protein
MGEFIAIRKFSLPNFRVPSDWFAAKISFERQENYQKLHSTVAFSLAFSLIRPYFSVGRATFPVPV